MVAGEERAEGLCGIILRVYLGSDLHHFYPHPISLNSGTRPHLASGESGKVEEQACGLMGAHTASATCLCISPCGC